MLVSFPHVCLTLLASFLPAVWTQVPTYFMINAPTTGTVWLDGSANSIQWTIAREDISTFDIEIARFGGPGLKLVAHNVPVSLGSLNVHIRGLPTADDYYVLFMNTSTGTTYSISNKFTITNSSSAANGGGTSNTPTASIEGAPSPTETWALTFDANSHVVGSAVGRPALVRPWCIGVLGLVGAGAISLL